MSSTRVINLINNIIELIDDSLYQSTINILNYRRYVIGAKAIYKQRGLPPSIKEVDEVCKFMNNPYNNYDIIHVAGTNGKGSVCLKLSNTLIGCNGYNKIGLLISPHINTMRERITINGIMINKYDFYYGINYLLSIENKLNKFTLICGELHTLLAFWYFNYKKCDIVVLETNLGGIYDATNMNF